MISVLAGLSGLGSGGGGGILPERSWFIRIATNLVVYLKGFGAANDQASILVGSVNRILGDEYVPSGFMSWLCLFLSTLCRVSCIGHGGYQCWIIEVI